MKRICVFLGSDMGSRTDYLFSVKHLAKEIVERDIELVYGAAKVGLMGKLADAVLNSGGRVIGVIPKGLTQKEIVHDKLTELIVVSSMHERKAQMAGNKMKYTLYHLDKIGLSLEGMMVFKFQKML